MCGVCGDLRSPFVPYYSATTKLLRRLVSLLADGGYFPLVAPPPLPSRVRHHQGTPPHSQPRVLPQYSTLRSSAQVPSTALNRRSMSIRLPLLLSLLATVLASEDPHAGHDHGGEAGWEWAGIFATPEDVYLWTAQSKKVRCMPARFRFGQGCCSCDRRALIAQVPVVGCQPRGLTATPLRHRTALGQTQPCTWWFCLRLTTRRRRFTGLRTRRTTPGSTARTTAPNRTRLRSSWVG